MLKQELIERKIVEIEKLKPFLNIWRFMSRKIVFTNGCFDLMHLGHIDYLSKASDMGDVLLVGVNTDSSVQRLKGKTRPIQDEKTRTHVLASLFFVDGVVLFDEATPLSLIKIIQPNVLVKGADWKKEDIVGYDEVKAYGGEVETISYLEGFSTTGIEQKILRQHL